MNDVRSLAAAFELRAHSDLISISAARARRASTFAKCGFERQRHRAIPNQASAIATIETFMPLTVNSWVRPFAIRCLNRSVWWLVRQSHDECQCGIQPRDVLVVEMADMPSDSLPPNGDGLISHNL